MDGLQVPGQTFHEIKYYRGWHDDMGAEYFDGVLGLSIDQPMRPFGSPNILPSPFKRMIDNHLLDANTFSIVWPTEAREQGSLIFGGYAEDLLDGKLISHPLFPENTAKWQIEMESPSMIRENNSGEKDVLVHHLFPKDTKGFFMSYLPSIAISFNLAQRLLHHVNDYPEACTHYPGIDCDEVPSLPEIAIGLKGQNVTLKGEDYVRYMNLTDHCPFEVAGCFLMIDYMGDIEDFVILGMPFLQKLMGVFNWDEKAISREYSHSGESWLC